MLTVMATMVSAAIMIAAAHRGFTLHVVVIAMGYPAFPVVLLAVFAPALRSAAYASDAILPSAVRPTGSACLDAASVSPHPV
jgi:hypothetical protein